MHGELIAAIGEWNPALDGQIARDTPLITSARLDSLGLFQLLLWIERKVGRTIDATAIDMATEWDTVDTIIAFVERTRGGTPP
ncbi:MAG TPA: acyl carrier protein [Candidatus Krumholzibacteria bacterium]|nr:acyl carrier protein [Candidatus Krumholzibacteria bacterium]